LFADITHPELEPKQQRALLLATDSLLRNASQAEQEGRLADAEESYRQATLRAPESAELHGLLAGVLVREMKWGEALPEFQRQIELSGPGAPNETQRQMIEALTHSAVPMKHRRWQGSARPAPATRHRSGSR
jgi:hypothetical protein